MYPIWLCLCVDYCHWRVLFVLHGFKLVIILFYIYTWILVVKSTLLMSLDVRKSRILTMRGLTKTKRRRRVPGRFAPLNRYYIKIDEVLWDILGNCVFYQYLMRLSEYKYKLAFALAIIQSRRSGCAIVLFLVTRYFPCRIR
jgi:hypothetical protein